MNLRFHWSLSSAGEKWRGATARAAQSGIPNVDAHLAFCRQATACGMESLLTAFGFHRPDPLILATGLGMRTEQIKFMVAVRSGITSPTAFVQQVNSISTLIDGRICLNVVAGHTPQEQAYYGDFLSHDERYERTDEFLTICHALWEANGEVNFKGKYYEVRNARLNTPFLSAQRVRPEIYLGGNSRQAENLAIKHADCLWRLPDVPEKVAAAARSLQQHGKEVGLLVSLLVRPTRAEAHRAARVMIEQLESSSRQVHQQFAKRSDSTAFTATLKLAELTPTDWLTPYLWTGAVPYLGAPAIALVGSVEDVAAAIMEYKQAGISQFLFMGWPDLEEMAFFSRHVLPLVRTLEQSSRSTLDESKLEPTLP